MDIGKFLSWQSADAVGYVGLVLTHYRHARLTEQFIVVEQRTGYGILYRHDTDDRGVVLHMLEHLLESGAADYLHLFTLEIMVCRNVVETSHLTLYCYSLHLFKSSKVQKKSAFIYL